jgi:hypothetical protein
MEKPPIYDFFGMSLNSKRRKSLKSGTLSAGSNVIHRDLAVRWLTGLPSTVPVFEDSMKNL